MNWFAMLIFLQHQHTRAFGVIRVVFNDHGLRNTCQNFADEDMIISKFVISMSGY
jgi:hypothetical protein